MPIYEYECLKCGRRFEVWRGMKDNDIEVTCPRCGMKDIRRVFSTFGTIGRGSCAPNTPT